MSKKLSKMNTCDTSLKEVWECFIISKTSKSVSDATLSNYHHHLRGIGKHLDIEMPLVYHTERKEESYFPNILIFVLFKSIINARMR